MAYVALLKLLITQYGAYVALGTLGVSLLIFFVIYIISIIVNRPITLGLGPFSLKTTKGEEKEKVEKIEQFLKVLNTNGGDVQCPLIDTIVEATKEKMEERYNFELKETIVRQMVAAEEANIKIKSIITNKYSNFLKTKLGTDESAKTHRDYRYYQVIVSSILNDVKRKVVKTSFENNYVLDFDDRAWEEFIKSKTDTIVTIVFDYIDLMYMNNKMVTLHEVHILNQEIKTEIKDEIKTLYRLIKNIIEEDEKRIRVIDEELEKDIDKTRKSVLCPLVQVKRILE